MNRKITGIFFIVLFVVISSSLITSCRKDDAIDTGNEVLTLEVPTGFPYPNIPDDNQPTKNRIALGKKLFSIRYFRATVLYLVQVAITPIKR